MRRRGDRPVLITNAERSQEDQLRTRQNRYIAMMSVRLLCVVAAAILVTAQVPLLWLWLALCAAGMILLPWFAVVLANDPLPKQRHRLRRYQPGGSGRRELPARDAERPGGTEQPGDTERPGDPEQRPGRTIDLEQ